MEAEEVLELMRSAPERYGSVRAAVARRSSALGTKQQRSRATQRRRNVEPRRRLQHRKACFVRRCRRAGHSWGSLLGHSL
jgi:hypothetical protein